MIRRRSKYRVSSHGREDLVATRGVRTDDLLWIGVLHSSRGLCLRSWYEQILACVGHHDSLRLSVVWSIIRLLEFSMKVMLSLLWIFRGRPETMIQLAQLRWHLLLLVIRSFVHDRRLPSYLLDWCGQIYSITYRDALNSSFWNSIAIWHPPWFTISLSNCGWLIMNFTVWKALSVHEAFPMLFVELAAQPTIVC